MLFVFIHMQAIMDNYGQLQSTEKMFLSGKKWASLPKALDNILIPCIIFMHLGHFESQHENKKRWNGERTIQLTVVVSLANHKRKCKIDISVKKRPPQEPEIIFGLLNITKDSIIRFYGGVRLQKCLIKNLLAWTSKSGWKWARRAAAIFFI